MDALSSKSQMEMARNVHDMGSINAMREAIASGDDKVLAEAAQQFEAIFVQMMLKSMRKAQDALADENSPFNSQQVKFYRDMHDQQLATDLTSGGGMGLADLIVKQLGQGEGSFTPGSVIRSDGNLPSLNRDRAQAVQDAANNVMQSASKGAVSAYKAPLFDTPEDFISAVRPHAERAAAALGVDAKAIISQAAIETGWGKYVIHDGSGEATHNLFGIKANRHWDGKQAVVDTIEFEAGMPAKQKAAFRAYPSIAEALDDYVKFISEQPRYKEAVAQGSDPKRYAESLQQAGYATDPAYADKIMAVYNSDRMQGMMP